MHSKFPGLPSDNGNCLKWCDVQLARVTDVHRSFLHRLQDRVAHFPVDLKVEFVSKTQEAGSEWSQQEEHMKDADASFQDSEREHSRRWEERRLKITSERDTKVGVWRAVGIVQRHEPPIIPRTPPNRTTPHTAVNSHTHLPQHSKPPHHTKLVARQLGKGNMYARAVGRSFALADQTTNRHRVDRV